MKKFLIIFLITIIGNTLQAQKELRSDFTNSKITVDGIIVENEYGAHVYTGNFIQMEPEKGAISNHQTLIYTRYDSANLYFGIKCVQESAKVIANIQNRDGLHTSDDALFLILDTYNDKRSAYVFVTNPIGTQTDFKVSDDGRNQNYEWDAVWHCKSQIHDWGWSTEFAIPFQSLRYKTKSNSWGFNVARIVRGDSELSWWSGELSDNFRISQSGTLSNLVLPQKSEIIQIIPYASVRLEKSNETENEFKLNPDLGLDANININSNFTLNGTLFPDFASVEGDRTQIDLSGWEINFPEKRLFFQEGNELFSMRYKPFYSRRVGDIIYGGKVTGKAGKVSMNMLNTYTVAKDSNNPSALFTVARVKADILKSSTIGAIIADKSELDSNYARTFGLDWTINQGKNTKITGQLIGSSPGELLEHSGGFLRIAHESNKHHAHIRYSSLGKSLKENMNQTGFLQDDDRHEIDADFIYTFWINGDFIKYIKLTNKNNAYWSQEGIFRGWKFRDEAKIYLQNKFSYSLQYDNRNNIRNIAENGESSNMHNFYNYFYKHTLGYNMEASSHLVLTYYAGRNFERAMKRYDAHFCVQPIKKLNVKYNFTALRFSPDYNEFNTFRIEHNTNLHILTLDYYFTKNVWIRLFGQSNTYNQKFYLYGQFGWRFKPPFGALYLTYAGDDYYSHDDNLFYNQQTVFLKLAYPIGW